MFIKIVPYAALGQLQPSNLIFSAAMVPLALAAMFGGVFLTRQLHAETAATGSLTG